MSANYIALDIGGTKIYGVRYSESFEVEAEDKVPTEADQGAEIVYKNIVQTIEKLKNTETQSVGIAWAGFVDADMQTIRKAPNISGFENFPLGQKVQKDTGIPVFIGNDARLFAYGEALSQSPIPKVSLGIIIGTGVGSGLIVNGEIYKGATNFAGEIGHISYGEAEIEDLVAGPGLTKFLQKDFDVEQLSDLDEGFDDESILQKVQPRLDQLTQFFRNLCLAFDPEEIVIGGGAGKYFWKRFQPELESQLNQKLSEYPTTVKVRFSELPNAGALGAGYLAKNSL